MFPQTELNSLFSKYLSPQQKPKKKDNENSTNHPISSEKSIRLILKQLLTMSAEEVDEQSASRDKPLRKIKEQENNTASGEDVVSNKPTSSGSTEKNKSTMQAASALTCLGNEDGEGRDDDSLPSTVPKKRYIPEHKKPDAALTFPEKVSTSTWQYFQTSL